MERSFFFYGKIFFIQKQYEKVYEKFSFQFKNFILRVLNYPTQFFKLRPRNFVNVISV